MLVVRKSLLAFLFLDFTGTIAAVAGPDASAVLSVGGSVGGTVLTSDDSTVLLVD